jgi:hypothetical protein
MGAWPVLIFSRISSLRASASSMAEETSAGIGLRPPASLIKESYSRKDSERKRKGTHYLSDSPAVIFGTSDLADVRVPKGPKHHVLVSYPDGKCEIRNLGGGWGGKMKIGGATKAKHAFQPGETAVVSGLKLTFVADIA